jgi:hypothetical protein
MSTKFRKSFCHSYISNSQNHKIWKKERERNTFGFNVSFFFVYFEFIVVVVNACSAN